MTRPRGRARRPSFDRLERRALLTGFSATGVAAGGLPEVRLFDSSGLERARFLAFDASLLGGVEVALGDVNGDGTPDIVAGAGPGSHPDAGRVRVFDGSTGKPLAGPLGGFRPFPSNAGRGVFVATGDVNGDRHADVIVGAGAGLAPRVKVYSGADGSLLSSFLAFHGSFRGGVRVATGHFGAGQAADVVMATGPGGAPLVKIYDPQSRAVLSRYRAFAGPFRGGVAVAAGDVNDDGVDDVVVGQGPGGRSRVRAFSGTTRSVLIDDLGRGTAPRRGVRVGVGDANGDGSSDVYVASLGPGAIPVRVIDGATRGALQELRTTGDATQGRFGSVAGIARRAVGSEYCDYPFEDTILPEYPLLDRLAYFDATAPTNKFKPFSGAISNSTTTAKNVYVIAHGWMPGYLDWVQGIQKAPDYPLPKSWDTWQTDSGLDPSTPWLFEEIRTTSPVFDVTTTGLAQQIHAVDPNATVLAYTWIDDSATCEDWLGIPEDVFHSRAYTTMNGLRMAEAVAQALAPDYSQGLGRVHLLGHSHGSRVATVAALALQRAAAQDPALDVVGQLTLLDSPEDNNADISDNNPIEIDAANFNWFELAQMDIARQVTLPGMTTAGSATVTGIGTSTLVAGMGVAGAGIAPGTTVASVDGPQQITLSAAATAGGSGPIAFTPPAGSIFVDNYVSYYGAPYNNFVVSNPDQGIDQKALGGVVDVLLNPLPFSSFDTNVISLEHEYAAAWYAGSQFTQGLPADQQVGLYWSPLIAGTPANLPATSGQTWTDSNLNQSAQFVLGAQTPDATVQPVFTGVTLGQSGVSGEVSTVFGNAGVIGVTLSSDMGTAAFEGTLTKSDDSVIGFSFDYDFAQVGDGAQLQIWLNDALYFAMSGGVARSTLLPGSGKLSTTFGLGYEDAGTQRIVIRLIGGSGASGTSTVVTVGNFHVFTLGQGSAGPLG